MLFSFQPEPSARAYQSVLSERGYGRDEPASVSARSNSGPAGLFVGYSDGSAHRIVSDLSRFIGSDDPSTHRILAAGDLNQIYGAIDDNRYALP